MNNTFNWQLFLEKRLRPLLRHIPTQAVRAVVSFVLAMVTDPTQVGALTRYAEGINWADEPSTKEGLRLLASTIRRWTRHLTEFQIPLFEIAYGHLDNLGDTSRPEIWLGRDGQLAYHGRVAAGADPQRVKYLLFSRAMAGVSYCYAGYPALTADEVREYFISNGIDVNGPCPNFIDSGYAGSIPEYVIQTLWPEEGNLGDRIHLFSSSEQEYQIPGAKEHWGWKLRDEIVLLERTPKPVTKIIGARRCDTGWETIHSGEMVELPSTGNEITLISPLLFGALKLVVEDHFRK